MDEPSVSVRNLTKSFSGRRVVDDLSFDVQKGEVFALLGHNGAGKSTTIDLILGLKAPEVGSARILGMDAAKNRKQVFERVGVQLQNTQYDTHGDEAACIIVDERGKLTISDVYDGFDEHTVDLLRQEVMPVDRMPDDSISVDEMKEYGYSWGGMLPMREDAAAKVMQSCTVYRLYGDNTEGMVMDTSELKAHAAQGGIFGVEKVEWVAALERENPLKAAEMSMEDDYGMIDGIINNGPKEDKSAEKGEKSSIMDRLKASKSEPPKEKPTPHKERKGELEL